MPHPNYTALRCQFLEKCYHNLIDMSLSCALQILRFFLQNGLWQPSVQPNLSTPFSQQHLLTSYFVNSQTISLFHCYGDVIIVPEEFTELLQSREKTLMELLLMSKKFIEMGSTPEDARLLK